MSWIRKLYDTYNYIENHADDFSNDENVLAPMWHSPQTAHIQITLNQHGDFVSAKVLPKNTIIMLPVTESSEGRTSGLSPHALCDSLQYVAKDLGLTYTKKEEITEQVEGKKSKKKKIETEDLIFNLYAEQLDKWCENTDNPKVLAVQKYVHKGQILADLIRTKIIPTDEHGNLLDNWKENKDNKDDKKPALFEILNKENGKFEIRKALISWAVDIVGNPVVETWKDKAVQQSWSDYYQSTLKTGICTTLQTEQAIRENHPAKLLYSGDSAKLISSNDGVGFTFRGKLTTANQVATISAEISHKAHAALRWLIKRQGIRNGSQTIITWAVSGKNVPEAILEPNDWIDWDNISFEVAETNDEMQPEKSNDVLDWSANLGFTAVEAMKKKLHGYQANLPQHEQLSLLALDSATPGRMAITYYQEFLPKDYFANLDTWIDDFTWYQRYSIDKPNGKKGEKRTIWAITPPSPYAIFETIYGKSADKDGKIKKQLYARLLPVISGGKSVPIPYDLVQQSLQAACNPSAYEKWQWERNIGVACALYRGYYARHHNPSQRRIFSMSLDIQNRSRDYLYGRLLAQAESLEWYALYLQNGKKTPTRATNAERYFQQFAQHPYSTWLHIEGVKLVPYKNYLTSLGKDFYKQAIGEIMEQFKNDDFMCDDKLSGEFLLGYHCQKMEINRQITALRATKQKKTETTE